MAPQSHWRAGVACFSVPGLIHTMLFIFITSMAATCQESAFPTVDRLPPGELLTTGERAVLPQGFILRPIYPDGLTLTKLSEGWVNHLYNDAVGYCTIGYGHLIKKSKCSGQEPVEFSNGIDKKRGEEILTGDLASSEYAVMTMVKANLSDGQYAALADFVFNVGSGNFRSSTLLRVVNANQLDRVSTQFHLWVVAGGKTLRALQQRRDREVDLFFKGIPQPKGVPQPGEDLSPIDIRTGLHVASSGAPKPPSE
jgi:lysozyme